MTDIYIYIYISVICYVMATINGNIWSIWLKNKKGALFAVYGDGDLYGLYISLGVYIFAYFVISPCRVISFL